MDTSSGHLQVKATDDWHVLAHHLTRYPQYLDIVTNHEAIATAAQRGMNTSHLIDAGSNATVTDHVAGALQHVNDTHLVHELVPEFAVAAILAIAAVRLKNGADRKETARWAREQLATAGLANVASLAVQVATGTVALRPVAAMGTRFAIARGALASRIGERASDRHGQHNPHRRRDGGREAAARRGQPRHAARLCVNHAGSSSQGQTPAPGCTATGMLEDPGTLSGIPRPQPEAAPTASVDRASARSSADP